MAEDLGVIVEQHDACSAELGNLTAGLVSGDIEPCPDMAAQYAQMTRELASLGRRRALAEAANVPEDAMLGAFPAGSE